MKRLVIDLESNGLLDTVSKIHCASVVAVDSSYSELFIHDGNGRIGQFLDLIDDPEVELIGHNIYNYDLKVIEKLHGWKPYKEQKITDTFLLAQILFPDIEKDDYNNTHGAPGKVFSKRDYGAHSLKAWGQRCMMYKGDYTGGWEKYSDEMGKYCISDTYATKALLEFLESKAPEKLTSPVTLEIENAIAPILSRQQAKGVLFDRQKAERFYEELQSRLVELKWQLQSVFKPKFISLGEVIPKRDNKVQGIRKGQVYTKIKLEEFNPNSRTHVVKRLTSELGWNPEEFTDKGNAKMDEEIIDNLPFEQLKPLKEYLQTRSLMGKLMTGHQAWIKAVKEDGRIHGAVKQNGAVTGRMTHHSPNLAQIPSEKKLYGKECRELFTVPKGKVMIGCDADSLEMRILAGYLKKLDNGRMIEAVIHGKKETGTDPHTMNAQAMEVDRETSKTAFYACVTMDTTVLTRKGWRHYSELTIGDIVLTYNQEKHIKEWKPILEIVHYRDAEVIEMAYSNCFKFKSTPNHRWFVRQRRYIPTSNSYGRINGRYLDKQIRTTSEINSESNIIVNAPMQRDEESNYTYEHHGLKYGVNWTEHVLNMNSSERQAFLQGFLLADGHKSANGNWCWSQNEGEIAEALFLVSYLESNTHIYLTHGWGTNQSMYRCSIGKKEHVTGQKLIKTNLPKQEVWCIRTENESFVARQGNTITITGNTIYGAKNAKVGKILLDHGIKLEEYVPDFEKNVEGMLKWVEKRNKEAQETGKEVLDRSRAYWECWVAGKHLLSLFGDKMPELPQLKEKIKELVKKNGYVTGLDGRKLFCRAEHGQLNTLCQAAGAIIMKKALHIADEDLQNAGLVAGQDYEFLLNIHDEWQLEVTDDKTIIETVSKILPEAIVKAGQFFNFPCPMAGNVDVGLNWGSTH